MQSQIASVGKGNSRLLAVSKLQSPQKIKKLFELGQRDFGENYVQEALQKQKLFADEGTYKELRWHFIGHLQSNKVKDIAGKFELIHSVDSVKLASKINEYLRGKSSNIVQKILLQINLSKEETKSGFNGQTIYDDFPTLSKLENVQICGLMTLPPLQNEPAQNRTYFQQLRQIQENLNKIILEPKKRLIELSMGTSHDFHIALEEGATIIRVGTLLFGSR